MIFIVGLLVLLLLFWWNLNIGSFDLSASEIISILIGKSKDELTTQVVWNIRLPRVILAALVGAGLAISGYFLQLIVKNPLADPYILGTSSGAALGANLIIAGLVGTNFIGYVLFPSMGAIIGGFVTTGIGILLAIRRKQIHAPTLLLAGVGLASINTAFVSLIAYLVKPGSELKAIIFWIMGSFERARMEDLIILLLPLLVGLLFIMTYSAQLGGLWIEEERARSLGIRVRFLQWSCLALAAIITSISVAFAGAIGFVGFIIPHFSRAIFGPTNPKAILFSPLLGASFLILCDIGSRLIYPPVGLPIGIMTSFIGIPFFLYLLRKKGFIFA